MTYERVMAWTDDRYSLEQVIADKLRGYERDGIQARFIHSTVPYVLDNKLYYTLGFEIKTKEESE